MFFTIRDLHTFDGRLLSRAAAIALFVVMLPGVPNHLLAQTPRLRAERFKNLGVAYLEENRPADAERAFQRVIDLAGDEALGYANLGIAQMRLGRLEAAASQLEQAHRIAPENADVLLLEAEVLYSAGQWESVVNTAQKVLEFKPTHAMARYYIYRAAIAQRGDVKAQQTATRQIEILQRDHRQNLVVAIRYARLQADRDSWKAVAAALDLIQPATEDVEKAQEVFQTTRQALASSEGAKVRYMLAALENVLRPTARFRQDLFQLQPPVAGLPILRFSDKFYAAMDHERPHGVPVQFQRTADKSVPSRVIDVEDIAHASIDFADVDGDGRDEWLIGLDAGTSGGVQLWQSQQGVWRDVLGEVELPRAKLARFVDLNDDGQVEVVAIGPAGTMVLRQEDSGGWVNAIAAWELKSTPGNAIELIDADNEGDLDICVAGSDAFTLWQNRPNQTLSDIGARSGLTAIGGGCRQIVASDHDDDLDTDLLVVGPNGHVQLWDNQRHGKFALQACGLSKTVCRRVLTRDLDNDGYEDLILVSQDGSLVTQRNLGGAFAPAVKLPVEEIAVTTVSDLDFDNDGWADLAIAGQRADQPVAFVLRNRGDGKWTTVALPALTRPCAALEAFDFDRDGDLELLVLDRQGQLHLWRNDGGNANHWLRVTLRGLRIAGSKNNLHGLGSKLEIKAGLFYESQTVRRAVTHFGLGARSQADLLRVVWSNGVPQNHFRPAADQTIREVQVLKGSCPYLYCWNGTRFVFVTDTLAGAPLGLQVADGVLAPDNPRELLTIERDKISPLDDEYIFQYTSELWETVYLDKVSLWAVDHPAGSEVFTDQRFLPPPYERPQPVLTRRRVAPPLAQDTNGRDVTAQVLKFDHRYPEQLKSTRYQGIVEPHCLTLHFGDVSELVHPVLMLRCWIFWTDTSINVAVSQDPTRNPQPTAVEVWNQASGWRRMDEPFGLPNGKDKWVVLDVAKHLDVNDAKVRIRSQSQIYWDQAFLTDRGRPVQHHITRLAPVSADVHFGGFNQLYRPTPIGPHLYRYAVKTDQPVWMNMTGFATRYGDVTQLLTTADDRFVIFTGGDEVTIRFDAAALPTLRPGWQRDLLFYSDGWEKDSDRNTVCGQTVEPLPFHGMTTYPYPENESYPQDQPHQNYLRRYNTRRIGPDAFRNFVKGYRHSAPQSLPWDNEPGVQGDHTK